MGARSGLPCRARLMRAACSPRCWRKKLLRVPAKLAAFNQSGQIVLGDQLNVAGDYVDHATRGGSLRRNRTHPAAPSDERATLVQRLTEERANLRLPEERMAGFVQSTDVPLQWIKKQRQLEARITDLGKAVGAALRAAPTGTHCLFAGVSSSIVGATIQTGQPVLGAALCACSRKRA